MQKTAATQEENDRIVQLALAATARQGEYVIGTGDLLGIEVFDVPELSRDVRVNESGTLSIPLIPVRVQASGLTATQLQDKLAELLQTNQLVSNPEVTITIKEQHSAPITVAGAVKTPMVIQPVHQLTLLEALSQAGGVDDSAGSRVLITRSGGVTGTLGLPPVSTDPAAASPAATDPPAMSRVSTSPAATDSPSGPAPTAPPVAGVASTTTFSTAPPSATAGSATPVSSAPVPTSQAAVSTAATDPTDADDTTITVDLNDLLDSGDSKFNIPLLGGDVVTVPRAGVIYAVGAVQHSGGFVMQGEREDMTVVKLLALAGGLEPTAKPQEAVIVRRDTAGADRQEIHVDLRKILALKSDDVRLERSDILYVPDSGSKHAWRRAGEIAIGLATGAALVNAGRL